MGHNRNYKPEDIAFPMLMGEKVKPRKEWIERNARYALNLDY